MDTASELLVDLKAGKALQPIDLADPARHPGVAGRRRHRGADGMTLTIAGRVVEAVTEQFVARRGVGYTKAYKVLHIKRPDLFPVLDARLRRLYADVERQYTSENRAQLRHDYNYWGRHPHGRRRQRDGAPGLPTSAGCRRRTAATDGDAVRHPAARHRQLEARRMSSRRASRTARPMCHSS